MHIRIGIVFVWLVASQFTFAQGISQSPYAQFGYGDLEILSNARFQAMGGSGTSLINSTQINLKNPAAAAYNRQYVTFEAGFYGQNANLASNTDKQSILSGNVNYLALLVPLSRKNWTVIAGIAPFSNAHTKYNNTTNVNVYGLQDPNITSATVTNYNTVDGGLNQVFLTNALKLPKGFSIGLTSSLVFGTITRRNEGVSSLIYSDTLVYIPPTKTVITSQEIYRFAEFKLGIGYHKVISPKYAIGFGLTGTFNQNLSANRILINNISSNNLTSNYSGYAIYSDTISSKNINAKLPVLYSFGFNIDKINRWSFVFDYTFTDYGNYKSFDALDVFNAGGHRVSVGTEFIPDYFALKGYMKRMVYRTGAYYAQLPYVIKNTQINDVGGSFGVGLPVGKGGGGILNLAIALGRRGTTDNGLVVENYFKFFVGVNINDRWFLRHKVD